MHIICDFDGTVTARDTNSELAHRFAPDAARRVEGRLASREMTLREVLDAEYEGVTVGLDEVVAAAVQIPFRAGFAEFLDSAEASGATVALLSSGFREVIEPMLERNDLAGRVPLVANSIALNSSGGRITWRDLPTCELCGEPCKRADVERVRSDAGDGVAVVFVGDGLSDRCGAEAADRIFARDSLAQWLDDQGVAYERWEDFDDISAALDLDRNAGAAG